MWEKVGVDVVFMPETSDGYKYIVFARDDLSVWVEGCALKENTAQNVAKFLYEDVICRHGCPRRIIIDGGSENKCVARTLQIQNPADGGLGISSPSQRSCRALP